MKYNEIERVQNTHSKREWVKIPILPNNAGKRSGTTGSQQGSYLSQICVTSFINVPEIISETKHLQFVSRERFSCQHIQKTSRL